MKNSFCRASRRIIDTTGPGKISIMIVIKHALKDMVSFNIRSRGIQNTSKSPSSNTLKMKCWKSPENTACLGIGTHRRRLTNLPAYFWFVSLGDPMVQDLGPYLQKLWQLYWQAPHQHISIYMPQSIFDWVCEPDVPYIYTRQRRDLSYSPRQAQSAMRSRHPCRWSREKRICLQYILNELYTNFV